MPATPDHETAPRHFLFRCRYYILVGAYLMATSYLFYHVHRQPFSRVIKSEQYETIFKGTSLVAVIGGIAMSSSGKAKYRQYRYSV
ncbi:hypothetical protein F5Y11DRAFT_215083 [Daldinia sp. FL1419]|nr:hypothetical protein F5Y11DRAFT_215083 [Daldinia sp. FL1419]